MARAYLAPLGLEILWDGRGFLPAEFIAHAEIGEAHERRQQRHEDEGGQDEAEHDMETRGSEI